MTFAAQHPGKCAACGDLFPEGTHIRRDETRGYRHADCDADATMGSIWEPVDARTILASGTG